MGNLGRDILERHARGGTWSYDPETERLGWSPGVYALHGVDPETYTPDLETALSFFTEQSREQIQAAVEKARRDATGFTITGELQRADGELRYVQSSCQIENRPGRCPLIAGAIFDVHDQVLAERDRAERERRLYEETRRWRTAGENAGLGLIEIDFDDDVYRLHGRFSKWLGLGDADEVVVPRTQWLAWIHEDDRPIRGAHLAACRAGQSERYVCEFRLCRPGRETVWLREVGSYSEDGAPDRIVGTVADVTGRKQAERALAQSERRLRKTLAEAPIGGALVALDGRFIKVNRALCEIVGYTKDELIELDFQALTHAQDLESDLDLLDDLLAGHIEHYRLEKRYVHKAGHLVDVQLDVSLLRDDDSEPLYFISHVQDISEQKRVTHALHEANALAEITFEAIAEGVVRVDRQGRITEINSAACHLLGVAREQCADQAFGEIVRFFDPDEERELENPLQRVLESGDRFRTPIFTRLLRHDGSYISIVDSVSPIHDDTGAIRGAVFVFQDISETRRMTQSLVHEASHDPLTGLPNRRGFEAALDRTWARVRQGALRAFVMYLDLDHFKVVNDRCGHAAGDELLRQVALCLRSTLRDSDVLARLGGDEFAAILHMNDAPGAQTVAAKVLRAVQTLDFQCEGQTVRVGVSIGIAALEPQMESTARTLAQADAALYVAKEAGRNCYHLYQSEAMPASAHDAIDTVELIESGLSEDRFELYLQAIVDERRCGLGFEALLRYVDDQGVVEPDAFLPQARQLGLMRRIDRWVVGEALALIERAHQSRRWAAQARLNVNLSPASIADPQFFAELVALLDQHMSVAHRIVFEVTESEALFGEHYPQLIRDLRQRGAGLWLDDFASGYNGLELLKRAEVDGLKIDRALVAGLEHEPVDRAVMRSIYDVSEALALGVVAEGVEKASTFDLLRRAGVTRFQGYFFHRPEPVAAALTRRFDTPVNNA